MKTIMEGKVVVIIIIIIIIIVIIIIIIIIVVVIAIAIAAIVDKIPMIGDQTSSSIGKKIDSKMPIVAPVATIQ